MQWKCIKWSPTHQGGLFMVAMAAFLNGCYGYLHTRYSVDLRLEVLLSRVRSPHFLSHNRSFSLVEVWGVTKESVCGGMKGSCVIVWWWRWWGMEKPLRMYLSTPCQPLCHDVIVCSQIYRSMSLEKQQWRSLFHGHWTQDKLNKLTIWVIVL